MSRPGARRAPSAGGGHLLAIDVGNTNTVFGVFRGTELIETFRLSTERERTADEHGALLLPLFERSGLAFDATEAVVLSSVVPPLGSALALLSERFFGHAPLIVGPELDTGMEIRYDHPEEVGADRIVNALAARELYGTPAIVVDFGTATTFDLVSDDGAYVGGVIAPGLSISAEALFARASRLYKVEIVRPERLIGKGTGGAMQAGLYYGYIGLVDGLLERLIESCGQPAGRGEDEVKIVGTGGLASLIASGSRYLSEVDPQLTLTGLRLIHDRHRRRS